MSHVTRAAAGLAMFVLGATATAAVPQAPPATEVFLAPLTLGGGRIAVGAPVNISKSPGYDNQPSFLPDGSAVLFTSNRDGAQTDIYRYTIASAQLSQLTHTAENEYSPLVAPGGTSFTCVHGAEQSLFRYDLDGANPRLAYKHGDLLIGYHLWIDDTHLAAFILGTGGANGTPSTLQVIDTTTGKGTTLDSNIGRSILRRDAGHVSFVAKSARPWQIKQFDIATHAITVIAETVPNSEDLTWLPTGTAVMGAGSKLFALSGTAWTEIADLAAAGVKGITRLAASPDGKYLAIVGQ